MCLIWKCCEQKEFWLTVRRQTLGISARPQREHPIENSYSPAIQKTKVNLPQTGNFPWLCLITTITTPKRNLRAELFQVHPDVDLPISGFPMKDSTFSGFQPMTVMKPSISGTKLHPPAATPWSEMLKSSLKGWPKKVRLMWSLRIPWSFWICLGRQPGNPKTAFPEASDQPNNRALWSCARMLVSSWNLGMAYCCHCFWSRSLSSESLH